MVRAQKIKKPFPNSLEMAIRYYSILNALNGWALTKKELQLIAFTCIKGNISAGGYKKQFIELFHSSKPSLANFIWKLSKLDYLMKDGDRITLHPSLVINFNAPIILQITLRMEKNGEG